MKLHTQLKAILAALQAGETLTHRDAEDRFGCARIAARVKDLKDGKLNHTKYDIETIMETRNGKRYARYRLNTPRLRIIDSIPAYKADTPPQKRTIIHINCDGRGDCPYPLAHSKPVENNNSLF